MEINSLKVETISRNSAKFVFTKDLQQRFGISFVNWFTKEIPKRCCNPGQTKKIDQKKSVIFCRIFFDDKTIFQKKSDHLYRSHFFSRFRKSHLEQRAIFLNMRTTRPKKKFLFFRSIYHLATLRFVNLLYNVM